MRFLTPRETAGTHAPFEWLRAEMDRLFENAMPFQSDAWTPALTLHENEHGYEVRMPVAGADPEKLELSVERGVLTVGGEREGVPEDAERRFAIERYTGRFSRSLRLPVEIDADAVEAHYEDGILRITLPKAAKARPRRIPVSV